MREIDDDVIYQAIVDRAQHIAADWRKDLAVRIANGIAEHLRRIF